MKKESNKCVMGCTHYTGGEIKHHYDCVYYPDSLSKRFDDLQSENEQLKAERDNTPIFHTCPECTWACSCSDQPCSCCKSQTPKQ